MKKLTTKEFIEKANKIHGNKYDYSKVEYINAHTKVCIICPEHGEFWQTPNDHLGRKGCPKCANNIKLTGEEFIQKAKKIHGDKYDYSKVKYINNTTKVCIICPRKGKCPKCSHNHKNDTQTFIEKAKKIHGDEYDYSKVEYINNHTKVCIVHKKCGKEFWQSPQNHLQGKGCPFCIKNAQLTKEIFIKKSNEIHQNKYDYTKIDYKNAHTKVCIICPEHGEFWQTPSSHISGQGCPVCKESFLERKTKFTLDKIGIKYIQEKTFKWLIYKKHLFLDFYLPDYNIAIECQGEQHFKPVDFSYNKDIIKAKKCLEIIQKRDKIKKELCENNGIKIFYINYDENDINSKIKTFINSFKNI